MADAQRKNREEQLGLRLTSEERLLLQNAAAAHHLPVTSFVRMKIFTDLEAKP